MPPTEQEWFAHLAFGAVMARRLDEAADMYRFLLRFAPHNIAWLLGLAYCLVNSPQPRRYEDAAAVLQELGTQTLEPHQRAARERLLRRLALRRQNAPAAAA